MIPKTNAALVAAFLASVFCAFAPVLLRFSEGYASANSVTFNFSWISLILLFGLKIVFNFSSPDHSSFMLSPAYGEPMSSEDSCEEEQRIFFCRYPSLPGGLLSILTWVALTNLGTQLLWAWSITQTTVATSEVLHSLSPPLAALGGWILFSQVFSGKFIAGIALSTIGTVTIFAGDMSNVSSLRGDGLALFSALFYAAYLISVEKLSERWDPIDMVIWMMGSTAFLCIPILVLTKDVPWLFSREGWLSLALLSLDVIINLLLITYSLKSLSAALVSTILLLGPFLTALLGWFFFAETLSWLNCLGFVIVLAGVYFSVISESEHGSKVREE